MRETVLQLKRKKVTSWALLNLLLSFCSMSSVSSHLTKGEVVVVVELPNANIPPASAQSGSTVASYHTGGQPARQCSQPRVSFAGQPRLREGSHARAEQEGWGRALGGKTREASCTTAHQQPARCRGLITYSRIWVLHMLKGGFNNSFLYLDHLMEIRH